VTYPCNVECSYPLRLARDKATSFEHAVWQLARESECDFDWISLGHLCWHLLEPLVQHCWACLDSSVVGDHNEARLVMTT